MAQTVVTYNRLDCVLVTYVCLYVCFDISVCMSVSRKPPRCLSLGQGGVGARSRPRLPHQIRHVQSVPVSRFDKLV